MSKDVLNRGKITRTSRGQLPRDYIAGSNEMQRHPLSVGRVGNSPERAAPAKKPKAKK